MIFRLINSLKSKELLGVVGPKETVELFAKNWCKEKQSEIVHRMAQGVYELKKVKRPKSLEGNLVKYEPKYREVLERFIKGFMKEVFPYEDRSNEIQEVCARHAKNETAHFLEVEGRVLAMAVNNRESKNAATISLVYTPPESRGKGYGSAVTALLSEKMLKQGKEKCNLFTDLSNPTSNSIYQKIGYQKIGESLHVRFS